MAYLIECDRCGETENVTGTLSAIPSRWLQFNTVWLGDGAPTGFAMEEPIEGGVFCKRCVKALRDWRRPIPKAMPDKAA